jgi:hypothetical protein
MVQRIRESRGHPRFKKSWMSLHQCDEKYAVNPQS